MFKSDDLCDAQQWRKIVVFEDVFLTDLAAVGKCSKAGIVMDRLCL